MSRKRCRPWIAPPAPGTPLGIYLHIPFCRKRCHFCYFRVYTDKNAAEIEGYLDAAVQELELYAAKAVHRRPEAEVHLLRRRHSVLHLDATSSRQLADAHEAAAALGRGRGGHFRVRARHAHRAEAASHPRDWASPGSASASRISTSTSCRSTDAPTARRRSTALIGFARSIGFPADQHRPDRRHGRRDHENWRECVRKTIALAPDSVTIYQMEIPYNTRFSRR